MKNIQIIDGAQNCTYDIYQIEDYFFDLIFPDGQDIEFITDLKVRLSKKDEKNIFSVIWQNRCDKKTILGIHGTLFFDLDYKKPFYPTKREEEMVVVL